MLVVVISSRREGTPVGLLLGLATKMTGAKGALFSARLIWIIQRLENLQGFEACVVRRATILGLKVEMVWW